MDQWNKRLEGTRGNISEEKWKQARDNIREKFLLLHYKINLSRSYSVYMQRKHGNKWTGMISMAAQGISVKKRKQSEES
eukprot:9855592-Ditylum_brightwellii.AAC.1